MSKFRKDGKKTTPMASTSSTSDIVFMFLFFFMVTTNLRKTENKVIGTPVKHLQAQFGTDSRIQLNDSFKTIDDIRDFIASERDSKSEADRSFMTVAIRADENTTMGIVTDVKQELRRCSALKIMYSARKAEK